MINVLFAGNDGVFDGILTCMLSIFLRTTTKEPFTFYNGCKPYKEQIYCNFGGKDRIS